MMWNSHCEVHSIEFTWWTPPHFWTPIDSLQTVLCKAFELIVSLSQILSLAIFILLLLFKTPIADKWTYLLCINFAHLYIISLMIACSLFSLTTATLMTKITFVSNFCEWLLLKTFQLKFQNDRLLFALQDFVFHIMAFLLYLVAGIWICVQDLNNNELNTKFIAVSFQIPMDFKFTLLIFSISFSFVLLLIHSSLLPPQALTLIVSFIHLAHSVLSYKTAI